MGTDTEPSTSITLLFLFTDVEGSTRLWQQYPEAMKIALARHDEILITAVVNCGGKIVKSTGDGFHAAFNSAQDGLDACIAAQRDLLAETWVETGPLQVRMGMHMGEAQPRSGDYYGSVVNRAARLMSAANGGQVLLSAVVAGMLAGHIADGVSLRDLGEHRLKDLQRPEHIFQLVHPLLKADFPAIASLNRRPNNLPSQPAVFVGRQAELAEINARLTKDTVRLLTLTGPGGTGKTRLALQTGAELSDRFLDGIYFIDLAPIRDPEVVLVMIARTIGLSESKNGSMLDDLKVQLGDKRILLLLDNFEQVTSAAVHVAELLQVCPQIKLLATSREALRVRGEHLYPVQPLGLPTANDRHPNPEELLRYEAVQLFLDRAKAVRSDFEVTADNAAAIAELCLRLDGLPLAIELAAARIRLFSPQMLRQQLGDRLKLLRGGARDLPERQQTLRDTIDWSFDLLAPLEKNLFAVVSVFSGCTFEAAEEVAGRLSALSESNFDILEGLESLVDKSLMRLAGDGTAETRLRMLETIREYAADQLKRDSMLHEAACQAHAVYYAEFAQGQQGQLTGYQRDDALAAMTADGENLRIAWQYWVEKGNLEQLQKMVDGLWLLYEERGWYQAMVALTSELLDVLSKAPSTAEHVQQEIMLRTSLARALMAIKGFTPEVEETFTQALALCEGRGEIPQLFPVLRGLITYYMFRSELAKASQLGERILELAESRDDDFMRLHAYLVLGTTRGFLSTVQEGLEILDKGVSLFDPDRQRLRPFQIGTNPGIVSYTTSAIFSWWSGYPDRAFKRAEKAIELATWLNHPYTIAYALYHAGMVHMWCGKLQHAQNNALKMKDVAAKHEYHLWHALATILLGAVESKMGETNTGLARLEQGVASYLGHITPPVFWPNLIAFRAEAYGRAGRPAEGIKLLNELLGEDNPESTVSQLPDLALLKGELLLAESPANSAVASHLFRQVLAVVQATGNKIFALQAATALCRLEMREGKVGDSGKVLASIYGGFTEGFDTFDLQEAKSVLEILQGRAGAVL